MVRFRRFQAESLRTDRPHKTTKTPSGSDSQRRSITKKRTERRFDPGSEITGTTHVKVLLSLSGMQGGSVVRSGIIKRGSHIWDKENAWQILP